MWNAVECFGEVERDEDGKFTEAGSKADVVDEAEKSCGGGVVPSIRGLAGVG